MGINLYKGKVIPPQKALVKEMNCGTSNCQGISCYDCINFPTTAIIEIKDEYLMEKDIDEYISEGLERLPDGRDSGAS